MKKSIIYSLFVIFVVISIGITSAILLYQPHFNKSPETRRWINAMDARIYADFQEIIMINSTAISVQLKRDGFNVVNQTNDSIHFRQFWIYIPTNGSYHVLDITIIANQSDQGRRAWLDVSFKSSFPETEIGKNKNWTITKVNSVVRACNLTPVDWDNVTWQISYQD